MKKVIVILAVLAMAGHALGAIGGSAHDFSGLSWNDAGEICNVCHTPHSPTNANSDAPLWDHESTTTVTLIPYSSGTLTATDLATAPQGVTKLCLSCHDGTIDLDDFGGNVGTNKIAVGFQVGAGGDLTGEHPVSFTYDDALATADGGLHPPTTTLSNLPGGGFIDDDLLAGATELECSSCHDVHDADSNPSLLVIDNANSALCLTCHDK